MKALYASADIAVNSSLFVDLAGVASATAQPIAGKLVIASDADLQLNAMMPQQRADTVTVNASGVTANGIEIVLPKKLANLWWKLQRDSL